jgi:threonyl-tRNA synthetase
MKPVAITLPDGSVKKYDGPTTPGQVARDIGKRLEEAAVAAKVNDKLVDLHFPIQDDSKIAIVTRDSKEGLEVIRHSTAHLLAQAVKELYPDAQITIGPVIEDGFYYDIDFPTPLTPDDLPKLEKRMAEVATRNLTVTRAEVNRDEAVQYFQSQKEHYKAEIIRDLPDGVVSVYSQGDFKDLCRGPHVPNTGRLGKFKLLSIAGAYWRGDEKNKMLQRIYGTAFATQRELDEHLARIEEAKKRDHRKLGPELGLFNFMPIAPAMPFYLPKGTMVFDLLLEYVRKEMREAGYDEVICPQLVNTQLFVTSGHYEHYKDNMFFCNAADGPGMSLKPMNCPGHATLYASSKHSYRDLPIRYAEFSKLHRDERAGVTHGLFRTRTFSQDDGHVFLTENQIHSEVLALIRHTYKVYEQFGFKEVEVKLATRPESFSGTVESWDRATKILEESLQTAGIRFELVRGDGAFYGPKIEFHIKDSLGRSWQCGTVQVDYSTPGRFGLEYVDSDQSTKRPVMIHRAILGSFERFMGILIEHFAGHFPFWLAPIQVTMINVTEAQEAYAKMTANSLREAGFRVTTDFRNEKLGYKIREAQLQKIPIMCVIGNKEMESKTLSIRRTNGETVNDLTLDSLQELLKRDLTKNPGGTNH